MKRHIALLILVILIISIVALPVLADNISPRLNNTVNASTNFVISTSGKATISAAYNGHRSVFTDAKITSYIEKRTLGLFWSKVDIGETNNEWVDTSTNYSDAFVHEFYLENTGTYRATVVYEISGTGGATDVIEYEQERTYS